MAIKFRQEIDKEFKLRRRLSSWPTGDPLKSLMDYLSGNFDVLISGRPKDLEGLSKVADGHFSSGVIQMIGYFPFPNHKSGRPLNLKEQEKYAIRFLKLELKKVFNYDTDHNSFVAGKNGALAYRHAKRLSINTCPYCNAQFTYTIKTIRGKARPQFDHFLNKSLYPYLALSFYNLIPSCATCNSGGIKGSQKFSVTSHLHPFVDSIEGLFKFRTNITAVDFLVSSKDFNLKLRPVPGANSREKKRATISKEAFAIEDRYKFHKDIAGDVLTMAYVYNNSAIEGLLSGLVEKSGKHIFKSKLEIKENLFGNYLQPANFHKRILSKLTADIAEEFGIKV
ncbi:hypothetical protein [Pedobacter sp. UBA4863]|uniref:hypothetical protein n=1 Tax=Pedobacter sp. UBA4863 TaxID=1947060 RepID=UPI0025FBBAA3|nr:hypothetical protein [Pedobacter sp. UBA4863]